MTARACTWAGVTILLVLLTRTIVYALSPSPLALHFEQGAGGPRLPIVCLIAILLGVGGSSATLWLVSLGVRERRALHEEPLVAEPRLQMRRAVKRLLWLLPTSCATFALVESTIHWRAGLGWHGVDCLVGPVHRNAIPILAALSLHAVVVAAAVEYVVAWIRRTIARLHDPRRRLRPVSRRYPRTTVRLASRLPCPFPSWARPPPTVVVRAAA